MLRQRRDWREGAEVKGATRQGEKLAVCKHRPGCRRCGFLKCTEAVPLVAAWAGHGLRAWPGCVKVKAGRGDDDTGRGWAPSLFIVHVCLYTDAHL